MAFCPKCRGEMSATALECPHCGYDFPLETEERRQGFAYSAWADMALLVGTAAAAIGAVLAAVLAVVALLQGQFLYGLLVAPLAFFVQLAQFVVFLRIQRV